MLCLAPAASQDRETPPLEAAVPFVQVGHLILVEAAVDGSDRKLTFVVDTGGRTFVDGEIATEIGLERHGPMVEMRTLELEGLVLEDVAALTVFDFAPFEKIYGVELHGMIGSDLLERFVVSLDYAARRLTFRDALPPDVEVAGSLRLAFTNHPVNNAPLIDCLLDGTHEARAMVNTGQPFPLVLPLRSFEELGLAEREDLRRARGTIIRWPMTRKDVNYLTRVERLESGPLVCTDLPVLCAELPPLLSVAFLGERFLRCFEEVILDYPNDVLLLRPRKGETPPRNLRGMGFRPVRGEEGEILVRGVWEGSPADEAGIAPDDRILRVGEEEAELQELLRLLEDESVTKLVLLVEREGKSRSVKLERGDLLPPAGE